MVRLMPALILSKVEELLICPQERSRNMLLLYLYLTNKNFEEISSKVVKNMNKVLSCQGI